MRIRVPAAVAVMSCAVALVATADVTASAAASDPAQRSPGVVLAERTVRHYEGQRMPDGGCSFTGKETVRPGAVPDGMIVLERETGYDVVTCTLTVERGFVTPAALAAAEPDQQDEPAGDTATAATAPTEGATGPSATADAASASAATTRRAFHKTYYEDPPGIDVTSARAEVEWTTDGSCIDSYWSYHLGEWGWFTLSGWERVSYSLNNYKDCTAATTVVEGKFRNEFFCRALVGPIWSLIWGEDATTWTEYAPTVVKGQLDGSYWMQWTAYKWGGCTNLLSFQRTHGYM